MLPSTPGSSDREPTRWFFLHMHKTGGTTLTMRLRRQFPPGVVYPIQGKRHPDAGFDVDVLRRTFAENAPALRLVAGHFPLCARDQLDVPFTTFTVLRDPVERTLSVLRSSSRRNARFEGQSLEAIYADRFQFDHLIHNHMVKMLSLDAEEMTAGFLTKVDFTDEHLERAKDRLLVDVDHVGLQDDLDGFCDELASTYDWHLGASRVANASTAIPSTDELRERIAHDNRLDVELYRFAVDLVRSRAEQP